MRAILIVGCTQLLGIVALIIMHWQQATPTNIAPEVEASRTQYEINEQQLRQLLADTLQTHRRDTSATQQEVQSAAVELSQPSAQAALLQAEMQYFESLNTVASRDMERMQADIVRLHPSERARLMNQLTQALNDGRINGRLL